MTSFAGDPDLCLTRTLSALMDRVPRYPPGEVRPPYTGFTGFPPPSPPPDYDLAAATRRFVSHLAEACTWQSSLLGTDVITVSESDAHGGEGAGPPLRTSLTLLRHVHVACCMYADARPHPLPRVTSALEPRLRV